MVARSSGSGNATIDPGGFDPIRRLVEMPAEEVRRLQEGVDRAAKFMRYYHHQQQSSSEKGEEPEEDAFSQLLLTLRLAKHLRSAGAEE